MLCLLQTAAVLTMVNSGKDRVRWSGSKVSANANFQSVTRQVVKHCDSVDTLVRCIGFVSCAARLARSEASCASNYSVHVCTYSISN